MAVSVRYIVHDVDACIPFYTELGFEVEMHPAPPFAALRRGDLRLLMNQPGAGGAGVAGATEQLPEPGGWNRIQITVEDIEQTAASLRAAGARFRGDIVNGNGGRQVLVEDPAGNPIELFQPHWPRGPLLDGGLSRDALLYWAAGVLHQNGLPMRIALFGQAAFGRDVFNALREAGEQIVGVSTPRQGPRPDPLYEVALTANIPIIETPALRRDEPFREYQAWQPDLLVFAFVTDIVRKRVLQTATYGAIQYHPSLLPLHRGRTAMNWAIMSGAERTGLTIFWVDEGIDTGPILLQREVEIGPEDTVGSLYFNHLYPMGVEALVEAVRMVREGARPGAPQNHELATYEPPCAPEHGRIEWHLHGRVIGNLIRGCDPQPGATARLRGETLRLFGAAFVPGAPDEPPGTVIALAGEAAEIAVIGGQIRLQRVQRDGSAKVAASDVLRPGDVLERVP